MENNARKPESERARKTREGQEKRLSYIREQIAKANAGEAVARYILIAELSKAVKYHDSGKIQGLFSLDTACSNNDFCPKMQGTEDASVICKYCYTKSMWDAARFAHHITGEIISSVEFTENEIAAVAVPAVMLRINSDGELINKTHAINVIRLAKTHPLVNVTIWTKRPAILDSAIRQEGKPENMICGVSSPVVNVPFPGNWTWQDFCFTVYTPKGMDLALKRGEHECNGKKCMDCGFHCYHANGKNGVVYIAEALRRPKGVTVKEFPGVIEAIDRATLEREEEE